MSQVIHGLRTDVITDGGPVETTRGVTVEESLDSDTLRLMSAAPDMARVLLDVEWQGWDEDDGSMCPCCRAPQHVKPIRYDADGKYLGYTENTHAADCALDAALRKAGVR